MTSAQLIMREAADQLTKDTPKRGVTVATQGQLDCNCHQIGVLFDAV